jgi:peptidoglycan/LPS O-acetylase OafA/YrhL
MNFSTTKAKHLRLALLLGLFTFSNIAMAQSGPDGPPAAPIDDFIVPMLVLGMIIYAVHFYRSNKQQAAKAV